MTDLQALLTENADLRAVIAVLEAEIATLRGEPELHRAASAPVSRNFTLVSTIGGSGYDDDDCASVFHGQFSSFQDAYAEARMLQGVTEDEYPTPYAAETDDEWQFLMGYEVYYVKAYPAQKA